MEKAAIIAECCQNHNGSFEILQQMVEKAVDAGADYVKIQSIRTEQLAHRDRFDDGTGTVEGTDLSVIKRPYDAEFDRLKTLELTFDEEVAFIELCKKKGVKSMTTVFALDTVDEVKSLGYDAVKVASYDCGSIPLLKALGSAFFKVFVSTGATTDDELAKSVQVLRDLNIDFTLLHCVTIYPTPWKEMNLARMDLLRMLAGKTGLSSHPLTREYGILADQIALTLGAECIERHYTVLDESETRDGPVSINPEQLKELCDFAKWDKAKQQEFVREKISDWESALGSANREMSDEEWKNRDYYRGRFASEGGKNNWE